MKLNKPQKIAIVSIIVVAIIMIYFMLPKNDEMKSTNQPRTDETTDVSPSAEYIDLDNLHLLFEKTSNFELDNIQKDKKLTTYIYKFTSKDANQNSNVFLEFGKLLQENGYEHISEIADGTGYKNQYELLYQDIHYMIYTECSPEKIILSTIDFNEEI